VLRNVLASMVLGLWAASSFAADVAEIVLPQDRTAYYADEAFELAVAGLAQGAAASVELVSRDPALAPLKFQVSGDGAAVNTLIPAGSLARGVYAIHLDGKDTKVSVTIAAGVADSTMLVSQTDRAESLRPGGANFAIASVPGQGLLGPDGLPSRELRRHGGGIDFFNRAIAADLPSLIYMYWTGYITHKPWGTRNSWEADPMTYMMRMFSLHVGQCLRRYDRNIVAIGTIDEPGLNYGQNPLGAWQSGFAPWDTRPWYEARGWAFTDDPASRPDDDWLRYLRIRTSVIGEQQAQARRDLHAAWPAAVFAADCYAVHVVCDGADAMNQVPNDIPCTHVFADWGYPRSAVGSSIAIEKAHAPIAPVAHAMNGQLVGSPIPQPQHRITYHVMMNAMLQSGLYSNWWLNMDAMKTEDLAAVNEPARRLGPLFREMAPTAHEVAVLWSFTELCLREKPILAKAAKLKTGESIKLMIASLPENSAFKQGEMDVSAYTVGQNYREQIVHTHAALLRAGFPAHVLHERVVPKLLPNYKVLVVTGQTHELPADAAKAIADFAARGGRIVVDKSTTVKFPNALVTEADFRDPIERWSVLFGEADKKENRFKSPREASFFQTNCFMTEMTRNAVAPTLAAMAQTPAKPIFTSDGVHLIAERHVAGGGALYMLLNAHDELPKIPDGEKHLVWNYAPLKATFTLLGIPQGVVVYRIDGLDWKTVAEVKDFDKPQAADFAAGEMKLYLVAPARPQGIRASARTLGASIEVTARLLGLDMPWPITVALASPDGKELFNVFRSMKADGSYREAFPVGANAKPGDFAVAISSPVANLRAEAKVSYQPVVAPPAPIAGNVRVFDGKAIADFLAGKPEIVIAIGGEALRPTAQGLAIELGNRGIKAKVADEKSVFERARYPRVWAPTLRVFVSEGDERRPASEPKTTLSLEIAADGHIVAKTPDGKDLGHDWRQPGTLATVVGKGFIDDQGSSDGEDNYEPGCKLFIDEKWQRQVLRGKATDVKATDEAKRKWSRPWHRLTVYQGGYNLPPQLPEAYFADAHLILLGDSAAGELVAALQASELLLQTVDARYPGSGKALLSFAWSPFALEKNVILIGAADPLGIDRGISQLLELAPRGAGPR